ncbi:MAG TPA: outer membrane lipoprotein-sorting protein [Methyloprofundus sp.]|uniref:outer membrane lipoprotein-sorting protein n=1 Tax=Methyloprofundus sp. TaxID=2020875 RepID=UPI0018252FDE|nr:outer membrane lipoprotein-sorting protein [Methyloprofundus sp.]HIG65405.1 outer membrane lipoprotein-sorting protein [Methyloprofundus sp.]HIL77605.1 outer membrane lipoprotein-sorting protein [Methylococcales bacterium]
MTLQQLFLGLSTLLASNIIFSATPSVDEIVNRTNYTSYYQGQDGKAKVKMTITDAQNRTRKREFVILRRDVPTTDAIENNAYEGDQKMYVYFSRPADVNKMVFMVLKKTKADDDRWLYLPALDLVKRIAASDKRTSFVGSDFLYEDVSGRNLAADTHALIGTDDNYYIIENTPVNPDEVEFSKYIMYIHKTTFLPVSTEYYDKQGKKYKTYTALAVDTIEGHPTITKSEAKNLNTGGSTLMEYSSVQYDVGIPDDIFSERNLRKPPRKLLR